jgi:hypothetical protein
MSRRLCSFLIGVALVLSGGALTACGSSEQAATASTVSAAPTPAPLKRADCTDTASPAPRANPLRKDLVIQHPVMDCRGPFDVVVDFTYYDHGNDPQATCVNAKASPNHRPCQLPLWQQPRYQSGYATPARGWTPVEGQTLKVACQVVASDTPDGGTLHDAYGHASNVWDKVLDGRLPGGFAWANDLWLGNFGWRGVVCSR